MVRMKKPWFIVAALLLSLAAPLALAQAVEPDEPEQVTEPAQPAEPAPPQPVRTVLETYVVNQVTRDDGTREERFTAATQARPGQIVEYRIIVSNVSEETLPPGIVVITVPVLEGTQFVPNSATPSSETLLTEFSADRGQTFAEVNVFIGLGDQRTIADPTAYDTVRWTVLEDMEPGAEITLVYRVTIR